MNPTPTQTTADRFREKFGTNEVDPFGHYSDVHFGEEDLLSFIQSEIEQAKREERKELAKKINTHVTRWIEIGKIGEANEAEGAGYVLQGMMSIQALLNSLSTQGEEEKI